MFNRKVQHLFTGGIVEPEEDNIPYASFDTTSSSDHGDND